jgi:hypothetical protein
MISVGNKFHNATGSPFDDSNNSWDLNTGVPGVGAAIDGSAVGVSGVDGVLSDAGAPLLSSSAVVPVAPYGAVISSGSYQSVYATSGNITFNLEFDTAALAAGPAFTTQMEAAATLLASKISAPKPIILNITVQYNENGVGVGGAEGGPQTGLFESYSTVRADLIAGAAAGDTNFNALPTGTSDNGFSSVAVWNAQLKAFGLLTGSAPEVDGVVDFGTGISSSLLTGVALHELAHAIGRVPYGGVPNGTTPDIFDLFRFTSAGNILVDDNLPAPSAAYFSVNGGTAKLADYGIHSDPSDFLNSFPIGGDVASSLTPNDAFNQYYNSSTKQTLTAVDRIQMDVLGFSSAACFCPGTLITTDRGKVAVQDLHPGMRVVTAAGAERPVRWIGWRCMDFTRHPDPAAARPIRILADAFEHGVPHNDLLLSPDHAVYIDGLLIPAKLLVNGMTIRQETTCEATTYYHVELDSHDVLLTEGLPTESYLDTGNRSTFENARGMVTLYPSFAITNDQARREAESCAPFAADAARVAPVWDALADRARALGFVPPARTLTEEPGFYIERAGVALKPVVASANCHVVVVPAGTKSVRLISRADSPAAVHPWIDDHRRLGVRVSRLTLRSGEAVTRIPLDDPSLSLGWWQVESDAARWTGGAAELPLTMDRPAILEIEFVAMQAYRLPSTPEDDQRPKGISAAA